MHADGAIRVPDGTADARRRGSLMPTVAGAGLPSVATIRWASACAVLPSAARRRVAPSSSARRHAALGRPHAAQPCEGPCAAWPCAVPLAPTFAARLAEPLAWPRDPWQVFRL